jgi:hypothetical protein
VTVKANQGMRQPQMGGVGSRLDVSPLSQTCKHANFWRLPGASKWICAVCHPPSVAAFEIGPQGLTG